MRIARWVIAGGITIGLLGLGVRFVGGPLLIRFPLNIDQSLHYTGTATAFVDPATLKPYSAPVTMPLNVDRRVHVVSGGFAHAVIGETIALTFGGSPRTETYRYVMDRRSMQLFADPQSYALGNPDNRMTPGGSFRINMPMSTSSSQPLDAFAPQTDSSAIAKPMGPLHKDTTTGTQVVTFSTGLDHPVAPYYSAYLHAQGLPLFLSPAQASAELSSLGADPAQLLTQLAPHVTTTQMQTLEALLSQPVPLRYSYFQQGQVSADHTTGAVVNASSTEGVGVVPDLTAVEQALQPVISQYVNLPAVQALTNAASTLSKPQAVLQLAYFESPASSRASAATARHQASTIDLIRWRIPVAMLTFGMVLIIAGIIRSRFERPGGSAVIHQFPVTKEPDVHDVGRMAQ